jgi:hypothetical protein
VLPLIHGFKGGSLQEGRLYAEVKVIFDRVADDLQADHPARAVLLRAASPHWLRHAYAKALVVDHQGRCRSRKPCSGTPRYRRPPAMRRRTCRNCGRSSKTVLRMATADDISASLNFRQRNFL